MAKGFSGRQLRRHRSLPSVSLCLFLFPFTSLRRALHLLALIPGPSPPCSLGTCRVCPSPGHHSARPSSGSSPSAPLRPCRSFLESRGEPAFRFPSFPFVSRPNSVWSSDSHCRLHGCQRGSCLCSLKALWSQARAHARSNSGKGTCFRRLWQSSHGRRRSLCRRRCSDHLSGRGCAPAGPREHEH